jgi:hypothetical protein
MPERYEYRVVEVRESLVGGKMSGAKLEKLLDDHASEGWQLKAITSADVKDRVGPGASRVKTSLKGHPSQSDPAGFTRATPRSYPRYR